MMAQDMTRVILVLVLLGACLAVAVFRPQILPPPTPTSASLASSSCSTPSQGGREQSLVPQLQSASAQPEPMPAPEEMAREEALKQWAQELEKQQAELDRLEKELEERQVILEQLEKEMNRREEELRRREEVVAQHERELDRQEAILAAEREELERLWRWMLAVAVITGLLALPSIFALYLLWKVNREAVESARSARAAHEEASWKATPSSRPDVSAGSLTGGNGRRQREEVRPRG